VGSEDPDRRVRTQFASNGRRAVRRLGLFLARNGPAPGNGEVHLAQIRIVQGVMPPMLAAIVRDVALAAPGAIMADAVPTSDLARVVGDLHPDVVVIYASDNLAAELRDTVICGGGRPVRVIVLSAGGAEAQLHVMRPHVTVLEDLSCDALLAVMRGDGAAHG
jgi:hypothetical protein